MPVEITRNPVVRRQLVESCGDVRLLVAVSSASGVDHTGSTSAALTYDAFGVELNTVPLDDTPYRFGGQYGYYRDDSDSVYVRARHYSPLSGRWISRDPIGFSARDWNLHRYVGNAPKMKLDPSGLISPTCEGEYTQCTTEVGIWAPVATGIGYALIAIGGTLAVSCTAFCAAAAGACLPICYAIAAVVVLGAAAMTAWVANLAMTAVSNCHQCVLACVPPCSNGKCFKRAVTNLPGGIW